MKEQRFVIRKGQSPREAIAAIEASLEKQSTRVTVTRYSGTRSDEQNRALWGVAYKVLEHETGNDPEMLHHYFCCEYFGTIEWNVLGKMIKQPRRTTTTNEHGERDLISPIDFANFYAFIQQRAADTVGVFIPDPDKDWRESNG